jgi:CYTH domain-containing protein
MTVVRRFLIPSAFSRAIRRERGVNSRIVEGHFQPRSDRSQSVRVERDECFLVLRAKGQDGELITEQSQVPLSQAEALIDVAPGRVAFDRTEFPLGHGAEGWLDRFIVPSGLDLLTVNLTSDPRLFAPALWFGREVTDDPQFETGQLALNGPPAVDAGEISNAALEALLDWIEGKSVYSFRSWARPVVSPAVSVAPQSAEVASSGPANPAAVVVGEVLGPELQAADTDRLIVEVLPASQSPETVTAEASELTLVPSAFPVVGEDRPGGPPRPTLRGEQPELEDGIARLARSLAPRRFRPTSASESVN